MKIFYFIFLSLFLFGCNYSPERQPLSLDAVGKIEPMAANQNDIEEIPTGPRITTVGQALDNEDNTKMYKALDENATYKSSTWNTANGVRYTLIPLTNTVTVGAHPKCRKYRTVVLADGKSQHGYGVACKEEDGTWKVIRDR